MERFYEPVFPMYLDDDSYEPVPGWGVNPLWAGPSMIAVGDAGDPGIMGAGDQRVLDAALAQQQATALAAQMKAEAKANPLYYVGGAVAVGALAFAVAPQGKGILAGVIGAALGAVGAHFVTKALAPKPGQTLIAAGTQLPAGSGVTTPPGSVVVASAPTADTSTPNADSSQPVLSKDSSTDSKPIVSSSTPSADTPKVVTATPPAASYADNLRQCQDLVEMSGGQSNLVDCMRSGGTPYVAPPVTNSGLVVSPAAAAAMLAQQSPGYAAGQALQAQMQMQAAAQAAGMARGVAAAAAQAAQNAQNAQAQAALVVQAAARAAQAQRDGAARAAAAAAAARG